jgi:hypothetical protein
VAPDGVGRLVVYFGDTAANAYALEPRPAARYGYEGRRSSGRAITGSPTVFEGRLYVPVASYEESQGADSQYPCCTFRGSVTALDTASGTVAWKTYMIAEQPQRRGTNSSGVPCGVPRVLPSGLRQRSMRSGVCCMWQPERIQRTGNTDERRRRGARSIDGGSPVGATDHRERRLRVELPCGQSKLSDASGPDHDFGSPPMLAHAAIAT